MADFLLFGGLYFTVLVFVSAGLLIWAVESTALGWATILLTAVLVALHFFSDVDPLMYALKNPLVALACFGAYFVVGAVWSIVKWYFHVLGYRDRYEEYRARWLKDHGAEDFSNPALLADFKKSKSFYMPEASNNKKRIFTWIAYWPFSALWTVVNDPLKRLVYWIYARLGVLFNKITKTMFGKYENEFN